MHLIHGTSLLRTTLPPSTSFFTLGKKIHDEKTLLLKIIWLYLLFSTCLVQEILKSEAKISSNLFLLLSIKELATAA